MKRALHPISKCINLSEFHNNFKCEIDPECSLIACNTDKVGSDIKLLSLDETLHQQIMENCSINNLLTEEDKTTWEEITLIKPRDNTSLNQFKSFDNFQQALNENCGLTGFLSETKRKHGFLKDLSYKNSRLSESSQFTAKRPDFVLDDIILTIIIYKPLPCQNGGALCPDIHSKLKPDIRVDLLGSQTLSDLENVIKCKNSESLAGDFSELMNDWQKHKACQNELYRGSFFFIENIFYNKEGEENLSSPIISWICKCPDRIAEFGIMEQKQMTRTRIRDLSVCVGKAYLYQHLGDCEHIFIISDVKLATKLHCQERSLYPIVTATCRFEPIKCCLCETANSEWIVMFCKLVPTANSSMCDYCLRMFLYDENNQKITGAGDFKVFRQPSFTFDHRI